jgi:hypothetical protein
MRRVLALAATALALAACAREPVGPTAPLALEQVPPAPGLVAASARRTAIELVQAYADAPLDGGAALAQLVTGSKLERWVYWLGVQNAQFPGRIVGGADLRRVRFDGLLPVPRAVGAQVTLGATVRFTFTPNDGEPFERARILDGPVRLVSLRPGDWRVVDLTRDGVAMSEGIRLFRNESRTRDGVSVRLDSLFMFTPNWQFNLAVENRSRRPVRLDPDATGLYLELPDGSFERTEGIPSVALTATIPPQRGVQGLIAFPEQGSAARRSLVLTFRRDGGALRFAFPLEDLVSSVPPPPPTDGALTVG